MIGGMKHEPGIFEQDDEAAIAAADERAMADFRAGRFYSHEFVSGWFKTFGKPDFKPFREWLADQDG